MGIRDRLARILTGLANQSHKVTTKLDQIEYNLDPPQYVRNANEARKARERDLSLRDNPRQRSRESLLRHGITQHNYVLAAQNSNMTATEAQYDAAWTAFHEAQAIKLPPGFRTQAERHFWVDILQLISPQEWDRRYTTV